jgi:hypothetical protein
MTRRLLFSVLALALLVPTTACQKAESVLAPPPKIVTEEATVAAASAPVEGELPAETPAELPLWPESKVVAGEVGADGSFVLVLETSEPYDSVVTGVSVGFERADWQVAEGAEEASATVLDVSGAGYEGIVTITGADEVVSIEYLLAPGEAS